MTAVLKTLVTFNVSNGIYPYGASPYSSLIADNNGDLFGTTGGGGLGGYGTVFEIVKTASTPAEMLSLERGVRHEAA